MLVDDRCVAACVSSLVSCERACKWLFLFHPLFLLEEAARMLVCDVYGYAMSLFVPRGVPGVLSILSYVIDVHVFVVRIVYNDVLDESVC